MHISKVSIVNYRNFRSSIFLFSNGVNTIIGENGSGKSNLFRAIRLLLDSSLYSQSYNLAETDFNRDIGDYRGHWIIISIRFSELSQDDSIQSLFLHSSGNVGEEKVEEATYNLIFRPNGSIRSQLSDLENGDQKALEDLRNNITIDDYETVFTGRSDGDFTNQDVYRSIVGDFENVVFPSDIDGTIVGVKVPNQLSIAKEISFTFIKALRDVVSDLKSSRNNPLYKLLQSQKLSEEEIEPIKKSVNELNESIEGLDGVQTIRGDIKDTILESTGDTYSPSSLSIKSGVSSDESKLFNSLNLYIAEPNETYEGDIKEMSLGGVNIIYLALKLLEYKYRKDRNKFANFILIEEPEAHIHTHIQKTLFDKINFEETQIIYSTHSPQISEVSKISKVNILSKNTNKAEVFQPATGLDGPSIIKLERYLDSVRSNLLFAKGVVLIEGDAEEILIPQLFKKIYGISLDELGISLINIRSTGFKNVAVVFEESRIRRNCSILTDLDKTVTGNIAAEEKGQRRANSLADYCDGNDYVRPFFATYTFEVDLLLSGNVQSVINLVEVVYVDENTKKTAKNELGNKDPNISGSRILKMAQNMGKGWFAITLSDYISINSCMSGYILDAVMFAKDRINRSTIFSILEYRMKNTIKGEKYKDIERVLLDYHDGKIEIDSVVKIQDVLDDSEIMKLVNRL